MTTTITDIDVADNHDDIIITVDFEPCWLARLFGWKKYTEKYVGSGTVWNRYPDGRRAPTWLEGCLADVDVAHEWRREGK